MKLKTILLLNLKDKEIRNLKEQNNILKIEYKKLEKEYFWFADQLMNANKMKKNINDN
jgi:hypothetical protein